MAACFIHRVPHQRPMSLLPNLPGILDGGQLDSAGPEA